MKKLLLMAAFALGCISASAQQTLTLSTYKGTDLSKYDGKTVKVSVSRYLFNEWNTIAFPFAMTEEQVNDAFGSDCKLEKLVGVENDGLNLILNFQDCKAEGIQANTPYILYYQGESASIKFTVENALIVNDNKEAAFVNVDETTNGFYATRCYVQMSSGNFTQLKTNHLAAGEVTTIKEVAQTSDKVEVFNLSGVKVADSIEGLEPGIYVINGKTVAVK